MQSTLCVCVRVVHGLGRPTGWVRLGWLVWVEIFTAFWWIGLGRGSETFLVKLCRPILWLLKSQDRTMYRQLRDVNVSCSRYRRRFLSCIFYNNAILKIFYARCSQAGVCLSAMCSDVHSHKIIIAYEKCLNSHTQTTHRAGLSGAVQYMSD